MAEAKQVAINREFVVSGFMSGQAYRIAVRIDTAATRLIRLGLRDFEAARKLEQELVDGMGVLEGHTKVIRKAIDKVNRRRREGVPTSSVKQNYMVRSLVSAQAFRCAIAVDQIQRDISMLGLSASGDVAKTANNAQSTISQALEILDSITESVIKRTDRQRAPQPQKKTAAKNNTQAPTAKKAEKPAPAKASKSERKEEAAAPARATSKGARSKTADPVQKSVAADRKPAEAEQKPGADAKQPMSKPSDKPKAEKPTAEKPAQKEASTT